MNGRTLERRPHAVDVHVGRRVRARRKAIGLNLEGLASEIHITYQQLQKYETGANRISASMLYEIACALRTPVAHFYGGLPQVLARGGDLCQGGACAEDVMATPGGSELLEAFLTMPERLREPLVAIVRGLVEAEQLAGRPRLRKLPTWR